MTCLGCRMHVDARKQHKTPNINAQRPKTNLLTTLKKQNRKKKLKIISIFRAVPVDFWIFFFKNLI